MQQRTVQFSADDGSGTFCTHRVPNGAMTLNALDWTLHCLASVSGYKVTTLVSLLSTQIGLTATFTTFVFVDTNIT